MCFLHELFFAGGICVGRKYARNTHGVLRTFVSVAKSCEKYFSDFREKYFRFRDFPVIIISASARRAKNRSGEHVRDTRIFRRVSDAGDKGRLPGNRKRRSDRRRRERPVRRFPAGPCVAALRFLLRDKTRRFPDQGTGGSAGGVHNHPTEEAARQVHALLNGQGPRKSYMRVRCGRRWVQRPVLSTGDHMDRGYRLYPGSDPPVLWPPALGQTLSAEGQHRRKPRLGGIPGWGFYFLREAPSALICYSIWRPPAPPPSGKGASRS